MKSPLRKLSFVTKNIVTAIIITTESTMISHVWWGEASPSSQYMISPISRTPSWSIPNFPKLQDVIYRGAEKNSIPNGRKLDAATCFLRVEDPIVGCERSARKSTQNLDGNFRKASAPDITSTSASPSSKIRFLNLVPSRSYFHRKIHARVKRAIKGQMRIRARAFLWKTEKD